MQKCFNLPLLKKHPTLIPSYIIFHTRLRFRDKFKTKGKVSSMSCEIFMKFAQIDQEWQSTEVHEKSTKIKNF